MDEIKPFEHAQVVAQGVEDGIKWCTAKAPIYGAINGYVLIPESHAYREVCKKDNYGAEEFDGLSAPGGITYINDEGWIGFDTLHAFDVWPGTPSYMTAGEDVTYWTAEKVEAETRTLAKKVARIGVLQAELDSWLKKVAQIGVFQAKLDSQLRDEEE